MPDAVAAQDRVLDSPSLPSVVVVACADGWSRRVRGKEGKHARPERFRNWIMSKFISTCRIRNVVTYSIFPVRFGENVENFMHWFCFDVYNFVLSIES